ncbi:MAG: hypothetical protein NT075_18170 [Chloroflexi bacterium]|nr:hypothetical protein [Chloroflexota bacterium]
MYIARRNQPVRAWTPRSRNTTLEWVWTRLREFVSLLLIISGTIAAYFSTLWTLAWREWTAPNTGGSLTSSVVAGL